MSKPVALTIAGSDSGGGAGIQADLKAMTSVGVHSCTVITAVTAQNSIGVQGIEPVSADFVREQIDSVVGDFEPAATKTGMLFGDGIIEVVVDNSDDLGKLVVDPVMVAESGDELLEQQAEKVLVEELLPLADLITPNLPEAKKIAGHLDVDADEQIELAREIYEELAGPSVLVKGGHGGRENEALDLLIDPMGEEQIYSSRRFDTNNTHGSGCAFSSLITSYMARGEALKSAIEASKTDVTEAIKEGYACGQGAGTLNFLAE